MLYVKLNHFSPSTKKKKKKKSLISVYFSNTSRGLLVASTTKSPQENELSRPFTTRRQAQILPLFLKERGGTHPCAVRGDGPGAGGGLQGGTRPPREACRPARPFPPQPQAAQYGRAHPPSPRAQAARLALGLLTGHPPATSSTRTLRSDPGLALPPHTGGHGRPGRRTSGRHRRSSRRRLRECEGWNRVPVPSSLAPATNRRRPLCPRPIVGL